MCRDILRDVRDELGHPREVWDGSGDTQGGPGRVKGHSGRYGMGKGTLGEVRGHSGRSGMD